MLSPQMQLPLKGPQIKRGSVQLDIDRCECNVGCAVNSPEKEQLKLPSNHNRKRVSIMLNEDMLRNGYPSLLILANGEDYDPCLNLNDKPGKSALKKRIGEDISKMEILSNCNDDSISDASDSYEMVEYGLNPYEIQLLRQSRRKSCLCWHPDVIFNEKEDSECTDAFPEDFIARLDQYYMDTEVTCI